jgi:hypothetical protein
MVNANGVIRCRSQFSTVLPTISISVCSSKKNKKKQKEQHNTKSHLSEEQTNSCQESWSAHCIANRTDSLEMLWTTSINKMGFWALKVIKVYLGAAAALLAQQQNLSTFKRTTEVLRSISINNLRAKTATYYEL